MYMEQVAGRRIAGRKLWVFERISGESPIETHDDYLTEFSVAEDSGFAVH
jgi:hypothetical protein